MTGDSAAVSDPAQLWLWEESSMPAPAPPPQAIPDGEQTEADVVRGILLEAFRALPDGAAATRHLDAALTGDAQAARGLVLATPEPLRGHCAMLLYWLAPLEALRAALRTAWIHSHADVVRIVTAHALLMGERPRDRLRSMFRRAAFPLPPDLPPVVRIWRGCPGGGGRAGARGLSWSLRRDTACWFALWPRRFGAPGKPLVLAADVPRSSLLFHTDARGEQEVVCFNVRGARIDGDEADWEAGLQRQIEVNRTIQAARMELAAADASVLLYPPVGGGLGEPSRHKKRLRMSDPERFRAQAKASYQRHREKRIARQREYDAKRREEKLAYNRAYHAARRDEMREYRRAYRHSDKPGAVRMRAMQRVYQAKQMAKPEAKQAHAARSARRRAGMVGEAITIREVLFASDWLCHLCGAPIESVEERRTRTMSCR